MMWRFPMSRAQVDIVRNNVCSERDDCDAKPGEYITEHHAVCEDRGFAPGLPLCPGVAKEREIGHFWNNG